MTMSLNIYLNYDIVGYQHDEDHTCDKQGAKGKPNAICTGTPAEIDHTRKDSQRNAGHVRCILVYDIYLSYESLSMVLYASETRVLVLYLLALNDAPPARSPVSGFSLLTFVRHIVFEMKTGIHHVSRFASLEHRETQRRRRSCLRCLPCTERVCFLLLSKYSDMPGAKCLTMNSDL